MRHRQHGSINHTDIPPQVKRDVILERDQTYADNLRSLQRRAQDGKIDANNFASIQQWLIEASLRRAKVNRSEAAQLAKA